MHRSHARRAALFLLVITSICVAGCPGARRPASPPEASGRPAGEGPLAIRVSKSGLGFRLSNADEDADAPPPRKVAPAAPLAAVDARKIAARLPAPKKDPADAKAFSLRDRSIPAPRTGKTVAEAFPPAALAAPPPPAAQGPLTVERRAPEGPVELAPHLAVTFSQPMVPVGAVDDVNRDRPPVLLSPTPPGKWRWIGTRTVMFQPDKRFPMATEYAVEVPAGTKSVSGNALASPLRWTFSTPPPVPKTHHPNGRSVPLEPVIFLELDQAIEPAELLPSIELAGPRGAVPLRLATADEVEADESVRRLSQRAEKGRWLALRPAQKLPNATTFTVRMKAGAPSAEGPRRTAKDHAFSFTTFGPMKVVKSGCSLWGEETCRPLAPFYVKFSNRIDVSRFDKAWVKVSPELPGLKVVASGDTLTVTGRSKGRTSYAVSIGGALRDEHGQTMGEDAKRPFVVGPAEPALFGAEREMVVLDPSSPRAYTVHSINEPSLRARVYAVSPEDWSRYGAYADEWERPRKVAPPGRLVYDRTITPARAPDELVSTPIDLAPALKNGLGQALVLVEPTRTPPRGYRRSELHVWVQATELGVQAFVERDRLTGWVTRLADGQPLEGVDVSVLGAPRASARTDREGLARVVLGDKGALLVARRGADVAIAPHGDSFRDDAFTRTPEGAEVRWLVYDDRGMYKPGEEVRIKGWLRRSGTGRGGDIDAIPNVAGQTVSFRVRDPRWAEIASGEATLDAAGSFDLAFNLPGNANLGDAQVELEARGVALSGTTTTHGFQIQEFRRPEFEVSARVSEGPHLVGKHAVATVTASYYAGGGLPSAPVAWRVSRTTVPFSPPNRSDFHFGPEPELLRWWRPGPSRAGEKTETWTAQTNASGVHRLRIDFDALDPPYPMNLDLLAQVEDVNRQQWAGRSSLLVHPAERTVGLRLARSFVREGENADVELIVTDLEGRAVAGRKVAVKLVRIETEQKGNEWEEREISVQSCEVESKAAPEESVRCSLRAGEGGRYRVVAVVTDEAGRRSQTAERLWVMGAPSPKDRGLDRSRVELVADKESHAPGEVAELLVVAPFAPAEGVLTLRRQGIVHLERFTMKSATHVLRVKLDDALVPNVEANVDLVGSDVRENAAGEPDPRLPRRPAFAGGEAQLRVLPTSRTLAVSARARAQTLEPGGATELDVEVKDPAGKGVGGATVAVAVVDEAVLALSGYKTPDPIAVFYGPRPSDVDEVELRGRVLLADPDLAALGGRALGAPAASAGAGPQHLPMMAPPAPPGEAAPMRSMAALEKKKEASGAGGDVSTPITLRSDFAALALFAPRVTTDGAGRATVALKVPDNLTRYRVMAVASSAERSFGASESTVTARLPVMVRPSAPRFLNFGDRFELPVVVQNQTAAPVDVGIVVRATNASVAEPSGKRVTVAANDRVEVRFAAAAEKAGTARFQIGVASGAFSDASEVELPVYTPATSEAFATYGQIDEGAVSQPIQPPAGVFPEFGGLEVTTSSTQLQALTDAFLYLVRYEFECNEQLASRVVSIAALRDVLNAFKAADMPGAEALAAFVKEDFARLERRQRPDGGWGFWQDDAWPYLTVHVTHALVRAKEKGYAPGEAMVQRARGYLRAIESKYPSWYPADVRRTITAYALYVRKRMCDADPARARRLIAEAGGVDKLPIEAVGWIWPTLSDDKGSASDNEAIRRHVANRAEETAGAAHFTSGYGDGSWVLLHSDRRADGILLEAMIGDQPRSTLIPKLVKGLLAHRKQGRWKNTQENAFVLLALDRYFATYEKATPDFVARVWLGDRFAGQHAFKGRTTEQSEVKIPMQWMASELKGASQSLVVGKDGPGRLYYRIGMQYAPTDLRLPPSDQGFAVSRVYEPIDRPEDVRREPDGTWRMRSGARVRVRVTMVAPARRYHVALVDPIAAGLEVMNPALAVTGEIPKDPQAEALGGPYGYFRRTWYEHQNVRDERVEAFASLLRDGVWEYGYVARATTPGAFVVPPAKAEEMYSPEVFGRSRGDRVVVE